MKDDCNSDCEKVVIDLPLMNGNETARIFEDSISIWSVYTSSFSMVFCICLAIFLVCLLCIPSVRSNKKSFIIVILLYLIGFIMLVGVFAAGIIFLATTPYYREDYSDCFSGDVSSIFPKLSKIEEAHTMLFSFQFGLMILLCFGFFIQVFLFLAKLEQKGHEV